MDTSMIANKLQDLIQSKSDIKSALAERNVEPMGGLPTYADAINDIQILIEESVDFSILGYDDNATKVAIASVQDDINYSKSLYDKYNGVLSGSAADLFKGDINLVYCPNFDTSNVTSMTYMFSKCRVLDYIPKLDTSNVTIMYGMFSDCTNLQTMPQLDTSNVNDMWAMFHGCKNLQTVPVLDTSNVTNMGYMFYDCDNLQSIPLLDTSNVTVMYSTFSNCDNIQTIPQLDTSNVTNMGGMFYNCHNLRTIPLLDAGNVNDINHALDSSGALKNVGGFINLGRSVDLNTTGMFSAKANFTHDSIMNIINNLYDRAAVGYSIVNLPLGEYNLDKISDAEKQIAINKGWTLS